MKLSVVVCSLLYCLNLCEGQSRYFRKREGHRLISGTPEEKIMVDQEMLCAMKCLGQKWCEAINLIKDNGFLLCELYSKVSVKSGEILKDELSAFYFLINVKDSTNVTEQTVPQSVTTSTTPSTVSAVACKKIFEENPAATDGTHIIFPGTANEAEVFCDMTGAQTGCNGGGWTLVMRLNGNEQEFGYDSLRWVNKEEYQKIYGKTLDVSSDKETKLSTYHSTPFTEICLGMKYNNQKEWVTLSLVSTSLFDLISDNTFQQTNLGASSWKGLISQPSTALQSNCPIEGINAVRGDTGVRIGIIATKTCGNDGDYNSRLGFGAKGTSCGQDGNNRCGNDARCDSKPNANSAKTIGYILVK